MVALPSCLTAPLASSPSFLVCPSVRLVLGSLVTVQMFAFQFVNSYCALFYVAFWLKDLNRLRSLLTTMMMVKQFISQLVEKYQPVAMRKLADRKEKKNVRRYHEGAGSSQRRGSTL